MAAYFLDFFRLQPFRSTRPSGGRVGLSPVLFPAAVNSLAGCCANREGFPERHAWKRIRHVKYRNGAIAGLKNIFRRSE